MAMFEFETENMYVMKSLPLTAKIHRIKALNWDASEVDFKIIGQFMCL